MAAGQQDVNSDAKPLALSAQVYQVVIVGAGFLADAFDLFVIDLVISILGHLYPAEVDANAKSAVASATLVGAIVGQLLFGFLGDWVGRRVTFLVTCVLTIGGAILSACAVSRGPGRPLFGLIGQLAAARFLLGVGVGGEYPLAAVIAAESAPAAHRGRMLAAVFSMQGWGILLACLVVLFALAVDMPLEMVWRFSLMFGAVPSLAVIAIRSRMEETPLFTEASRNNQGATRTASAHAASSWGHIRKHGKLLLGTTMTWLLLDVTFYGTGSFKHRFSSSFSPVGPTMTPREQVWQEASFATLCACLAIPGYLMSILWVDAVGRYRLQLFGFLAMAANFLALGAGGVRAGGRWPMLLCFGFTFLFSNFGPNTTTFMLPAEVYPTVIRATCHGISAAAGKLGAVIGTLAFSPCEAAFGLDMVLVGCGVVSLAGAGVTWGLTPRHAVDLCELDALLPDALAARAKPAAKSPAAGP